MRGFRSDRLRGLPRPVWVLLAGTLVTRAGSFAVTFLTVYLHRERGLPSAYVGLALACWGVGGMVASLSGGALADRLGRKPVVVGSPVLGGLSLLLLAATHHPVAVLGASLLAGIVSESGRPAVSAMLADLVPPDRRVDAFALFRLVINLGFAVGAALGGLLAARLGFVPLFVLDAATSWIYALVALVALPETRPEARTRADDEPARGFRTVAADPLFRRFWLATLATAFVFAQPMATLGLVLADRAMSTAAYGALISLNGLVIISVEFWLSGIVRRGPPPRMLALGAGLIGVGFALTGLAGRSLPLLVGTVVVWTAGEMVSSPTSQAYLATISPPDLRGRYSGAFGLSWSVGFTVGPVLGGLALAGGGAALWLGSIAFSAVAAALYLTLPTAPAEPNAGRPPAGSAVPAPVGVRSHGGRLLTRFARPRS